MRKWVQIALAVVIMALLGLLAWQILKFREPVYGGKPLTIWLEQYGDNHWSAGRSGELGRQAETAIRQIGTNAIPRYLEMMNTRASLLKLRLMLLLPKSWLARFHMRNLYEYRLLGAFGLIALGADSKPSVPALTDLLKDNDPELRYPALFALRSLGPVAVDALPSVVRCLKDADFRIQSDAILGLGELRQSPEQVIPLLVELLTKPQNQQHAVIIRANALWALGQFGGQAKPAVPALVKLLNDEDGVIRSDATNVLLNIDPEAAAGVGVK